MKLKRQDLKGLLSCMTSRRVPSLTHLLRLVLDVRHYWCGDLYEDRT